MDGTLGGRDGSWCGPRDLSLGGHVFIPHEKGGRQEATEVVAELLAQISAPTFPGTPFFTRAELWADLVAAKEERIAAAAQLLENQCLKSPRSVK